MKYKIFTCISGALLLMVVAFQYGYPLVTSDTAAYLRTGFAFEMPRDRSPFYGPFLRHTSLWTSLWYTIFAQSLILSFLLIRYIRSFYTAEPGTRITMLNLIVIISCTYVSWVCSYLMPDIFGGILLLAILLYLREKNTPRLYRFVYLLLITFSVLTHNSHVVILGVFSGLILLASLLKRRKLFIIKSISLLSISISAFFFMCILNKNMNGVFTFSKGSHVFIMGKLAETGVLKEYLDATCAERPVPLCDCRDQLMTNAIGFIWSGGGAFDKTGGWEHSAPGYDAVINDLFTTPKYAGMFFLKSLSSTLQQLTKQTIFAPTAGHAEYVYPAIEMYFRTELREFRDSGQYNWQDEPVAYNKFYLLILVLSTITVFAIYNRLPDKRSILLLYAILGCFIFCNAYVTATFANVLDRLNTKVFWLLPATNLIVVIRYLSNKWSMRPEIDKN